MASGLLESGASPFPCALQHYKPTKILLCNVMVAMTRQFNISILSAGSKFSKLGCTLIMQPESLLPIEARGGFVKFSSERNWGLQVSKLWSEGHVSELNLHKSADDQMSSTEGGLCQQPSCAYH